MRNRTVVAIAACVVTLVALPIASCTSTTTDQVNDQAAEKPAWLTCPNCLDDDETQAAREKTASLTFDPRDLSGVWGQNRVQLSIPAPPLTPEGQKLYDATKADAAADGSTQVTNTKDGMLICDP